MIPLDLSFLEPGNTLAFGYPWKQQTIFTIFKKTIFIGRRQQWLKMIGKYLRKMFWLIQRMWLCWSKNLPFVDAWNCWMEESHTELESTWPLALTWSLKSRMTSTFSWLELKASFLGLFGLIFRTNLIFSRIKIFGTYFKNWFAGFKYTVSFLELLIFQVWKFGPSIIIGLILFINYVLHFLGGNL